MNKKRQRQRKQLPANTTHLPPVGENVTGIPLFGIPKQSPCTRVFLVLDNDFKNVSI
jgi:hypothetical protein